MRRWLVVVTLGLAGALSVAPSAAPDREIDNLIAFARLYGVVRWFYPGDGAAALDWDPFARVGASRVRGAADPQALAAALDALVRPLGPGIEVAAAALPPAPPLGSADPTLVAWRYYGAAVNPADTKNAYAAGRTNRISPEAGDDRLTASWPEPRRGALIEVDLGGGLRARVPLALTDAEAKAGQPAARQRLESDLLDAPAGTIGDTSIADVVVAWNVYRHFYPYWRDLTTDPAVDWDAELRRHLMAASAVTTRAQAREVLERLVAAVHDGHGNVIEQTPRGSVPVALRLIEDRVVVVGSGVDELRAGPVVTAVDGTPVDEWLKARVARRSGTPQWRTSRALAIDCDTGSTVSVRIEQGLAHRAVAIPCAERRVPLSESRPAPVSEVRHGVWYVDLTRAKMDDITPKLADIAAARGVVFDVRGYPTDAGFAILPHLIDAPEHDRWMHIERITGPFNQVASVSSMGWNVAPKAPRVGGTRVFLTDGRAISYAESVMGYVADRRLATIVGGPTAGANGNVVSFFVPSGRRITLTGMRVTRHDGTSRFHMIGVQPTVPLAPTLAGLRGGRDELLEHALALIDGRDLATPTVPPGAP
jgi:hypothetical protein